MGKEFDTVKDLRAHEVLCPKRRLEGSVECQGCDTKVIYSFQAKQRDGISDVERDLMSNHNEICPLIKLIRMHNRQYGRKARGDYKVPRGTKAGASHLPFISGFCYDRSKRRRLTRLARLQGELL